MKPKKLITLHRKLKKLEAQLENLKDEIAGEEMILLEQMQNAGTGSLKPIGGGLIRIDRKIWASAGGDVQGLVAACKASGLEDLVKEGVNGNTLSGYVREYDPDKNLSAEQITKKLPKGVRNAIRVTEKVQLVVSALGRP